VFSPEIIEDQYCEQLVYVPETVIAIEKHCVPDALPTKSEYGLPEDKFIFCCFNNSYRNNRSTFNAWMKILSQVPDSVLWLGKPSDIYEENIRQYAIEQGIDSERIIFKQHDILNRDWPHRLADLYLDTIVISGGTTGILSAWIGLPVITIAGKTPQSRFGAGIMNAANGAQFIVNSTEEYIKKAVELAMSPDTLKQIKQDFLQQAHQSPLFDQRRYIQFLEKAYEEMWIDHISGHKQKHIYIQ